MKTCKVVTLYSGSGGNAIYIRVGETAILVDAGKSARTLCRSLCEIGADIADVRAVFVTHEHSDHVSALEVLSKKYDFPIHIMEKSATRFDRLLPSLLHEHLVRHEGMFCETVGELTVSSFRTPHDSRMSVGYRISFLDDDGEHVLGIATDIGYVSDSVRDGLCGCEAVVLECNHDVEMLMTGPYPADLKRRIASRRGHLSNTDCAAFSTRLAQSGMKRLLLAHLSETNNLPDLALSEVTAALAGCDVSLHAADPVQITTL